ncbi:hypothetical protein BJP50_25315 [Paenibacillus odorifer]|nr:hypothetical protein BJP46_25130 [Paenibacillus odorifer]OMD12030.1 hypothetical protein BJP50_25315 [Paenibacillus odorifer]
MWAFAFFWRKQRDFVERLQSPVFRRRNVTAVLIEHGDELVRVGSFKVDVILKPTYPAADFFALLRQPTLIRIAAV